MSMTKQESGFHSMRDQRLSVDNRHFSVIYVLAFLFYLPIFSFARLLPSSWRSQFLEIKHNKGVIAHARVQARLLASYATMN